MLYRLEEHELLVDILLKSNMVMLEVIFLVIFLDKGSI